MYLYKGDTEGNTKALSLSKEVIDSQLYELATDVTTYKQVWSEASSKEMIFSIVNFDSKDWADREGLAYVLNVNGYYNAFITKKFYEEMKGRRQRYPLECPLGKRRHEAEGS